MPATPPATAPGTTVPVWDLFVRVFHWSLVGLFAIAFATGDEATRLHILVGQIITALLIARIVWGFIGSTHARLVDFLYRPTVVLNFLRDTLHLRARRYLGHNPAGGLMVIVLILLLAALCITGLMMTSDAWWGEEWLEDLHEGLAFASLGLVALHLAGVLVASLEHGENLVRAMITGRKRKLTPGATETGQPS